MDKHLLQELKLYIDKHLLSSFSRTIKKPSASIHTELKETKEAHKEPFKKQLSKELISRESLERDGKTDSIDSDLHLERRSLDETQISYMQCFSLPRKLLEDTAAKADTESDRTIGPEELKAFIRKKKSEDTFSTKLLKYIDRTGLTDSEIYKRAGIDRRHFSKIRCDKNYKPKKSTAIALCLALRLNIRESEELIGLSGYTLTYSDTGDLVVRFCIERGIYNLLEVNDALDYFGAKAIGVIG